MKEGVSMTGSIYKEGLPIRSRTLPGWGMQFFFRKVDLKQFSRRVFNGPIWGIFLSVLTVLCDSKRRLIDASKELGIISPVFRVLPV
jgi:hypothetical protein